MNEELIKKLALTLVCMIPGGLVLGASFIVRRRADAEKARRAKLALVPHTETIEVAA